MHPPSRQRRFNPSADDVGGQSDDRIIAQGGYGFQGHVAGALDGPFVVLFEQDRADEPADGVVVRKDADDISPAPSATTARR